MSNINLQEPQRNHNATANFVNLIRTSTVVNTHANKYFLPRDFTFCQFLLPCLSESSNVIR